MSSGVSFGAASTVPSEVAAAPWMSRTVAALIDLAIALTPPAVVSALIFDAEADAVRAALVVPGLFLLSAMLYAPLLMTREGRHHGQTLGKQLFGIRVVRDDGRPLDLGWSALREVVIKQLLFGLGAFLFLLPNLLDALWPLWDGRGQALHDKIAASRVVTVADDRA